MSEGLVGRSGAWTGDPLDMLAATNEPSKKATPSSQGWQGAARTKGLSGEEAYTAQRSAMAGERSDPVGIMAGRFGGAGGMVKVTGVPFKCRPLLVCLCFSG